MFLHQGDSMVFLLYLYAALKRGEGPGQHFRRLGKAGYEHLLGPLVGWVRGGLRWVIKHLAEIGRKRNVSESRPQSYLEQARFELLAAYPVDRANPPVAQRIRMLRLQQSILYGRLRPQGLSWSSARERLCQEDEESSTCLCLSGMRQ